MYDDDIDVGLEKVNYPTFLRQFQVFRESEISTQFKKIPDNITLPIGSTLHLLDNIKKITLSEPISDTPSVDTPFITNDHAIKVIYHQTRHIPGPVPLQQGYVYRDVNLAKNLQLFRYQQGSKFRFETQLAKMNAQGQYLGIINHNPLFRTFFRGALPYWRAFATVLASILNCTALIPNRFHYFLVPMIPKIYPRSAYNQAFNKLSSGSLVDKTSYQYCLMVQIMLYLNPVAKIPSVFSSVPEEIQRLLNFIFECEGQYYIVNLYDLKTFNKKNALLNRIINQFNVFALKGLAIAERRDAADVVIEDTNQEARDQDEADKTVEDQIIDQHNKIKPKEAIKSELVPKDTEEKADDDKDLEKLLAEINGLAEGIRPVDLVDLAAAPFIQEIVEKQETAAATPDIVEFPPDDVSNEPQLLTEELKLPDGNRTPITTAEELTAITEAYLNELDTAAEEHIQNIPAISPARRDRIRRYAKMYRTVQLDGEPLETVLTKKISPAINTDDVTVLKDTMVDKSMTKSTICDMDRNYLRSGLYKKHIVKAAISLTGQGMFLTGMERKETVNQLDQTETYTLRFRSADDVSHTVKFTLPIIRDDGTCMINGVKSYLKKQMCNMPICKVSPTRVSLATNYNKTIVERKVAKSHSLSVYFNQLVAAALSADPKSIDVVYGSAEYTPESNYPYDYAILSETYRMLTIKHARTTAVSRVCFDQKALDQVPGYDKKTVDPLQRKYRGLYIGSRTNNPTNGPADYFIRKDGVVIITNARYTGKGKVTTTQSSLVELLVNLRDLTVSKQLTEWVDIKILDKKFPVIFLLAYRYGLKAILKYLNVDYVVMQRRTKKILDSSKPERTSYNKQLTDITIRFQDADLIFPRYPLQKSLIIAGLDTYDLSTFSIEEFDQKDVYFTLLGQKYNYLRGIDNFFNLFIDGQIYEVLKQLHEPTNPRDLLIRATDMLSTSAYKPASSVANHRIRGYERLPSIVYNEISREFANFSRRKGSGASFSINPKAVLLRVIQDQAMMNIEEINPIHDLKLQSGITYTGVGGRTSESFVTNDRKYPKDGVGTISEATVDSGNVAITAMTSMDPVLTNVYGISKPVQDVKELKPTQVLSVNSLVMPGVTQDDPKRSNMSSIQMSHALPTEFGECARIRTGYETMVAQKTNDLYAYTAREDGIVEDVDEKLKMLKIRYKSGETHALSYDTQYGICSELVTTQKQVLTVKKGDKFKKHDILRYNPQFFEPDQDLPRQVCFKHGTIATVALIDTSTTFEDSSVISESFGQKVKIQPVQTRVLDIPTTSVVRDVVKVGDSVEINTPLLVFEDSKSADLSTLSLDEASLEYLEKMSRTAPKAKYAGQVVKIACYYGAPITEMHPSLITVIKEIVRRDNQQANYAKDTATALDFVPSGPLPIGSKFKGIDITDTTVIFQFYIQESVASGIGDKIVIDSSLKTVTSTVRKIAPVAADSGREIDVMYAATGVSNRIVTSPFVVGMTEAVLEKEEQNIIDMYFGK